MGLSLNIFGPLYGFVMSYTFHNALHGLCLYIKKKSKDIPVTGRGGL
jgi:hypothetical protein